MIPGMFPDYYQLSPSADVYMTLATYRCSVNSALFTLCTVG
jgi:hypothetical protein